MASGPLVNISQQNCKFRFRPSLLHHTSQTPRCNVSADLFIFCKILNFPPFNGLRKAAKLSRNCNEFIEPVSPMLHSNQKLQVSKFLFHEVLYTIRQISFIHHSRFKSFTLHQNSGKLKQTCGMPLYRGMMHAAGMSQDGTKLAKGTRQKT